MILKKVEDLSENLIFASRWLQAPMYLGLVVAAALYTYKFAVELTHLFHDINSITEEHLMLGVLTLVDMTMVANLVLMVIIGGYATFVSRLHLDKHEDRPEWLKKIDAGTMKVKLAGSLVGVSGIHLLKTFINIQNKPENEVKWQITIHIVFLFSTLLLAITEKVLHSYHSQKA